MREVTILISLILLLVAVLAGGDARLAQHPVGAPSTPDPSPSPIGPLPSPSVPPFYPPNEPPALPFRSLSLEISAPAQSVLLLQPIPLVVKLNNNQSRPALGYKSLGFGKAPIYIDVRKTDATNRLPITELSPVMRFITKHHVVLQPGEVVRSNDLFTLRLSHYFPEPGNYEMRAKLANNDGLELIESNPVIITVREPGPPDRLAYNLIRDSQFGDFLFSGAEFQRVEGTLETLAALYPQSPYARYANFVLGEVYFHRRDHVRALPRLMRLEHDNGFIFAEKVRRYLAEIRAVPQTQ